MISGDMNHRFVSKIKIYKGNPLLVLRQDHLNLAYLWFIRKEEPQNVSREIKERNFEEKLDYSKF